MPIDLSNNSFAQDNRAAGSDDANVGGTLSSSARDGGVSLGIGATYKGVDLSGVGDRTVTITDGGAFDFAKEFASKYTTNLSDFFAQQNETASEQSERQSTLLGDLVKGFGALVESKNTGGESSRNQIFLWLGLGSLAVLGLFLWRKRA